MVKNTYFKNEILMSDDSTIREMRPFFPDKECEKDNLDAVCILIHSDECETSLRTQIVRRNYDAVVFNI